jgi:carbamoyl-phosphate synthase large subunit
VVRGQGGESAKQCKTMSMRNVNILFLGGAKRVSLAQHLIDRGEKMDLSVHVFSYELQLRVPIASIGKVIIGKKWSDASIYDHLFETIISNKIDIVLPFVDPAIEIAAVLKFRLPSVFIPCSSVEICRTMFDKLQSQKWFECHEVPIPPSYSAEDEFEYPIIIKPRTGSASKGIVVIHDRKEWDLIPNHGDYVIQKYIEHKEEYTVDCYVACDGKIISVVPRIRIEVAGGEVMNARTIMDEEIIQISTGILNSGGFRGPVTIQFIKDLNEDKVYVMEINPRLGGGVICSIEAGADITSFLLKEYLGEEVFPITDWKDNTLMTRYYKEVMFYADNN